VTLDFVGAISSACLDDDIIAGLADAVDREADRDSISHLATCAHCRARLAAVVHLLRDRSIAEEVERLAPRRQSGSLIAGVLTSAAAAALAGLMLWPEGGKIQLRRAPLQSVVRREGIVTATVAPRIVSPAVVATAGDSLRWTTVPRADLYRVIVWNRAGAVVWQGETRDTALPLPPKFTGGGSTRYLWKVDARTGWDRWVSSALRELTIRTGRGGTVDR
jgi:hypothetical protein